MAVIRVGGCEQGGQLRAPGRGREAGRWCGPSLVGCCRQGGGCWGAPLHMSSHSSTCGGCWQGPRGVCWGGRRESISSLGVAAGLWGAAWPPTRGVRAGLGVRGLGARGVPLEGTLRGRGVGLGHPQPRAGNGAVCSTPANRPAWQFLLPSACGSCLARGAAAGPGDGFLPRTGCDRGLLAPWRPAGPPLSPCPGVAGLGLLSSVAPQPCLPGWGHACDELAGLRQVPS